MIIRSILLSSACILSLCSTAPATESDSLATIQFEYEQALRVNAKQQVLNEANEGLRLARDRKSDLVNTAEWLMRVGYAYLMQDDSLSEAKSSFEQACALLARSGPAHVLKSRECMAYAALVEADLDDYKQASNVARVLDELPQTDRGYIVTKFVLAAVEANKNEDNVKAINQLSLALMRIKKGHPNDDPFFVGMVAFFLINWAIVIPEPQFSTVAIPNIMLGLHTYEAAVGHYDPDLFNDLSLVALSSLPDGSDEAREVALWILDVARRNPEILDVAQGEPDTKEDIIKDAIETLRQGGYEEEGLIAQWEWQDITERRHGHSSVRAAQSLNDIAASLIESWNRGDAALGDALFARVDEIIRLHSGEDSKEYKHLFEAVKTRPRSNATASAIVASSHISSFMPPPPEVSQVTSRVDRQASVEGSSTSTASSQAASSYAGGDADLNQHSVSDSTKERNAITGPPIRQPAEDTSEKPDIRPEAGSGDSSVPSGETPDDLGYYHCLRIGLAKTYCDEQKRAWEDSQNLKVSEGTDSARTLSSEIDTLTAAVELKATADSLQQLIDLDSKIDKAVLSMPRSSRAQFDALTERLADKAIGICEKHNLVSNWRFRSFIVTKAKLIKGRDGFEPAVKYLNSKRGLYQQPNASLSRPYIDFLGAYPRLIGLDYIGGDLAEQDRRAIISALEGNLKELIKIGKMNIKKAVDIEDKAEFEELVQQLIEYGKASENMNDVSSANKAFQEARRIAGDKQDEPLGHIYEDISGGLARSTAGEKPPRRAHQGGDSGQTTERTNEMDAISARTKISRAKDSGSKAFEARDATHSFYGREGAEPFVWEFAAETVKYDIADLRARGLKLHLSPWSQLGGRQESIRDDISTLFKAHLKVPTKAHADFLFTALQWFDVSRAGSALKRAAARTTISPQLSGAAREFDQNYLKWVYARERLIDDETGTTEDKEKLSSDVDNLNSVFKRITIVETGLRADKRYLTATTPGSFSLNELQAIIRQNEAVVRFLPSEGGALNAALITKGNFEILPLSEKTPGDADIDSLVKSISSRGQIRADLARSLYSNTIKPLEHKLANVNELTIVADGGLSKIPFPVLITNNDANAAPQWLVERFAFRFMPSLSSLVVLREKRNEVRPQVAFLGFADPNIAPDPSRCPSPYGRHDTEPGAICSVQGTSKIIDALARAAGTDTSARETLTKSEFTVENVASRTSNRRIGVIAFATHAFLSEETEQGFGLREPAILVEKMPEVSPQRSVLTASLIEKLNIDADLAVLAACNTDASEADSDALSGLARAFFEAGVRGAIVTRWAIEPAPTTKFLEEMGGAANYAEAEQIPFAIQKEMVSLAHRGAPPREWAMFLYAGR